MNRKEAFEKANEIKNRIKLLNEFKQSALNSFLRLDGDYGSRPISDINDFSCKLLPDSDLKYLLDCIDSRIEKKEKEIEELLKD